MTSKSTPQALSDNFARKSVQAMYLRFQTRIPDPRSGRPTGILVAARELRDGGKLGGDQEQWLRDCLGYFDMHLKNPKCQPGTSWFREHSGMVRLIHDLAAFMEQQGIPIDTLRTDDPGIVHYEDSHQVVARNRPASPRTSHPPGVPPPGLPSFLKRKSLTRKPKRGIQE